MQRAFDALPPILSSGIQSQHCLAIVTLHTHNQMDLHSMAAAFVAMATNTLVLHRYGSIATALMGQKGNAAETDG